MDTASVASDIPDIIQCLRYPSVVKLDQGEFGEYGERRIQVLHRRQIPNFNEADYDTRDLFKFPKTNIIQEDLSFLAITGLLPRTVKTDFRTNDTPIIGASIIQNCKDRFKTRSHPVKVHATINADKVVNKEKLYLVVKGIRQNKVYELKSTENTIITNDSKVEILKESVQPNVMDKKKKKSAEKKNADKKNKDKKKKNKSLDEPEDEYQSDREVCKCPPEPVITRSQIKISGTIGFTKDNGYLMDCETTVHDKPIQTRYYESETNTSSDLFQKDDLRVYTAMNSNGYYQPGSGQSFEDITTKRNSSAQTGSSNNSPRIVSTSDSAKYDDICMSKESQSTQANFNICVKNNKGTWSFSPKCGCGKFRNNKDNHLQQINFNDQSDKVSQEPIVVISVYPKKAVIENKNRTNNETVNSVAHKTKSRQKSISPMSPSTSVEKAVKKETKRASINESDVKNKKNQRGSSPKKNNAGGAENKNTNIENVKSERATIKTTQRQTSVSPKRSDKQLDEKDKKINKNSDSDAKQSTKTKSVQTEMKRESSPKRGNTKITKTKSVHKETTIEKVSRRDASQQKNSNISTVKQTSKSKSNQNSTNSENKKSSTKSVNNDKEENNQRIERSVAESSVERPKSALRTILDNVLKHPKVGVSDITINIDAENEFYNVFLRHNPNITDLKLKKVCICPPDARAVRGDIDGEIYFNNESSSMTNFLLQSPESDSNRKRAKSQTTIASESNEKENSSRKLSFTKARDSLEISHMRDDLKLSKSSMHPQGPQGSSKHFTGDQCLLIDPLERDKEVRQLLGVNTNIEQTSASNDRKRGNEGDGDNGDFLSRGNEIQIFRLINDNVVPINSYKCVKCESINDEKKHRKKSAIECSSFCQQIMLVDETEHINKRNRYPCKNNVIHVTVANNKPMILTKSQYVKVKRAIQSKILKAASAKKFVFKRTGYVSVSDPLKRSHKSNKGKKTMHKCTQTFGFQYSEDDIKDSDNLKPEREIQTTDYEIQYFNESSASLSIVRIGNTNDNVCEDNELSKLHIEARYCSMGSIKKVKFDKDSKSDCELKDSNGDCINNVDIPYSVKTIFQYQASPRKKKSLTPNLGPSISSLYADNISIPDKPGSSSMKYILPSQQKKKPFLRRLMSCLVMRAKTSRMKMKFGEPLSSGNTDTSYHISTTLAPMEMTSSLFDTSISFYSNHAIVPINNKMKKCFLSSMRGLLKKN